MIDEKVSSEQPLEALAALAAEGDETALAAVLARLLPAVHGYAGRAVCPGLDFEDAVQEGLIGLFASLKGYRPGTASFYTYSCTCIHNAILSAQRRALAKKQGPLNDYLPLEDAAAGPDPAELTIQREEMDQVLTGIDSRLSILEKQVLAQLLAGHSYAETARLLGLPPKAVDNAVQRIRRKLR